MDIIHFQYARWLFGLVFYKSQMIDSYNRMNDIGGCFGEKTKTNQLDEYAFNRINRKVFLEEILSKKQEVYLRIRHKKADFEKGRLVWWLYAIY